MRHSARAVHGRSAPLHGIGWVLAGHLYDNPLFVHPRQDRVWRPCFIEVCDFCIINTLTEAQGSNFEL